MYNEARRVQDTPMFLAWTVESKNLYLCTQGNQEEGPDTQEKYQELNTC